MDINRRCSDIIPYLFPANEFSEKGGCRQNASIPRCGSSLMHHSKACWWHGNITGTSSNITKSFLTGAYCIFWYYGMQSYFILIWSQGELLLVPNPNPELCNFGEKIDELIMWITCSLAHFILYLAYIILNDTKTKN